MNWDVLVAEVTSRHPEIRVSAMFGMPCFKRDSGKVIAPRRGMTQVQFEGVLAGDTLIVRYLETKLAAAAA